MHLFALSSTSITFNPAGIFLRSPRPNTTQDVTVDGICVLSKSGPYKREWMNRFPWRRRKDDGYELYVTEEGIEVQLEEKKVWGVSAADMTD